MLAATTRVKTDAKEIPSTLIETVKSSKVAAPKASSSTSAPKPKATKIDIRPESTTTVTKQPFWYNMVTVFLMFIGVAALIATTIGVWTKL